MIYDPDQWDPENASRGSSQSPFGSSQSFGHPAPPPRGRFEPVAAVNSGFDDAVPSAKNMAATHVGAPTHVAKKQVMHDPDQYDPENAARGKSRAVAAAPRPASNGASSYAGYGKAAAPVRVHRGEDGVIYDPDQYDPDP